MPSQTTFHTATLRAIRTKVDGIDFGTHTDVLGNTAAPVIRYDNDPRSTPDNAAWVLCTVRPSASRQVSMGAEGSRLFRHTGTLVLIVHTKLGTGSSDGEYWCDRIASTFRGVTTSGVTYETPYVTNLGRDDGGQWFRMSCRIPWYADDNET